MLARMPARLGSGQAPPLLRPGAGLPRAPGRLLSLRAAAKEPGSTTQAAGEAAAYRGVTLDKRSGRWKCRVSLHGTTLQFGVFPTARAAAEMYDRLCWAFAAESSSDDTRHRPTNFGEDFKHCALEDLGPEASAFAEKIARAKERQHTTDRSSPVDMPKGVQYDGRRTKPYRSRILHGTRRVSLGWFATQKEAEAAYERAKAEFGVRDGPGRPKAARGK